MDSAMYWLATAFSALLGTFGLRTEETPTYQVLDSQDHFELRSYPPLLVAETRDAGTPEEAANASFRRLARYIFGANGGSAKIAMTAPVVMQPEKIAMTAPVVTEGAGGERSMRFVLPSRFTRETVPRPDDAKVVIREIPAEKLAVVRFRGRSTPEAVAECEQVLRAWVASRGLTPSGPARLANYDGPYAIPLLRRNEVMIPVDVR